MAVAQLIDDVRTGSEDPVVAARRLAPLLAANAAETERGRRVVEENVVAMRKAGLFRLLQPRRYGGAAASMATFTDVVAELAGACASSAWVASVANHCAWLTAMYPRPVLDQLWGQDATATVCGVFQALGRAERADGGVRLSGKWPYGSGSLHAGWALLGYAEPGVEGPESARVALVPMSSLTIEDTWQVSGLKGTGSHTLVAADVFVPAAHSLELDPVMSGSLRDRYPGEASFDTPFSMVMCTLAAGPMLGLGRAMLDLTLATIGKRAIYTTVYDKASDAPTVQIQLGEAASLIDSAAMFAERLTADADRHAAASAMPGPVERARVRMDTAAIALHVARAMELLININGASSFSEKNPVQRMSRDFEVMRRHASVATELSKEHYGRALLGKPGVILIA